MLNLFNKGCCNFLTTQLCKIGYEGIVGRFHRISIRQTRYRQGEIILKQFGLRREQEVMRPLHRDKLRGLARLAWGHWSGVQIDQGTMPSGAPGSTG